MGCALACAGVSGDSAPVEQVQRTLNTGDIMLFSASNFQSWMVRVATCSPYSHVAMVVRSRALSDASRGAHGPLYVWHSPATRIHGVPDVLTAGEKTGPQLNDLSLLMRNAFCRVHLRRLRHQRTDVSTPALLRWMRKEVPKRYERSFWQLAKSAYDGPGGGNRRDLSSYFCSELVAQAYIEAGLLDPAMQPSNEYTPADFAGDRLALVGVCHLDDACAIR